MSNVFDLKALNQVKASEAGYEYEFISEASPEGTGVFVTVLGEQSDKVKAWVRKKVDAKRYINLQREKSRKDNISNYEDDEAENIEAAAIRIVSWKGIYKDAAAQVLEEVECNLENAKLICGMNNEFLLQVIKNSNDIANFTKAKPNA